MDEFDYSKPCALFLTLVTHNREALFAHRLSVAHRLTPTGLLVEEEWNRIPQVWPHMIIGEYVVMPDHFHAILFITDSGDASPPEIKIKNAIAAGARRLASTVGPGQRPGPIGNLSLKGPGRWPGPTVDAKHSPAMRVLLPGSLGAVMAQFKSRVTKRARIATQNPELKIWQSNFYERIIRSEKALAHITRYIQKNPFN